MFGGQFRGRKNLPKKLCKRNAKTAKTGAKTRPKKITPKSVQNANFGTFFFGIVFVKNAKKDKIDHFEGEPPGSVQTPLKIFSHDFHLLDSLSAPQP